MTRNDLVIWGIVVAYLAFIAVKGMSKANRVRDVDDFLLASRDVGWLPLMCTLGATLIGGGASIGAVARTAEWGVAMVVVSLGWYAQFVLSGWLVAGKFRDADVYTVAGYFGKRFGRGPQRVALYLSLAFSLFMVAAQMAAFGTVVSAILPHADAHPAMLTWSILVGGLIVVAYSCAGGLLAVIDTDVWQFGILLVGFLVVAAICVTRLASGDGAAPPARFFALDGGRGWLFVASTFVAFLLGEAFAPGYATRFCAGRDARHVRRGAIVAGAGLGIVFPVLVLIIAWYARAFVPSAPPGAALPSVIASVANPWLTGLLIAALLCAVMSSADSALNSATAIFVKDLFEDEWGWRGGERALTTARWCTVLLGVASIAVAAALPDIIGLLLFTYHLWAPAIVAPMLLAALSPAARLRSKTIATSMVLAIIATLAYRLTPWAQVVDPIIVGVGTSIIVLSVGGGWKPPGHEDDARATVDVASAA